MELNWVISETFLGSETVSNLPQITQQVIKGAVPTMVCPSSLLPQSHSLQGHLLNINLVTLLGKKKRKKLVMSRNE